MAGALIRRTKDELERRIPTASLPPRRCCDTRDPDSFIECRHLSHDGAGQIAGRSPPFSRQECTFAHHRCLKQGKSIEVAAAWGIDPLFMPVGSQRRPFIPPERSKKSSRAARSHPNRCGSRCTRPRINLWECRRNDRRAHPPDGRPLLPQMAVQRELRYRSRAGTSRTIGTLSLTIGRSAATPSSLRSSRQSSIASVRR